MWSLSPFLHPTSSSVASWRLSRVNKYYQVVNDKVTAGNRTVGDYEGRLLRQNLSKEIYL